MALTAREKKILRMIISRGNTFIAQRMKDYAEKTDAECLIEIDEYKTRQSSIIAQQRATLDAREADILDGGAPVTLPEGQ